MLTGGDGNCPFPNVHDSSLQLDRDPPPRQYFGHAGVPHCDRTVPADDAVGYQLDNITVESGFESRRGGSVVSVSSSEHAHVE